MILHNILTNFKRTNFEQFVLEKKMIAANIFQHACL